MVELVGSKSRFGIEALLAPPRQGETGTFRSLIDEFDPEEAGTVSEDKDAIPVGTTFSMTHLRPSHGPTSGELWTSPDAGRYTLRLELDEPPDLPAGIGKVACWPATLAADRQQPLKGRRGVYRSVAGRALSFPCD